MTVTKQDSYDCGFIAHGALAHGSMQQRLQCHWPVHVANKMHVPCGLNLC